MVTGLSPSTSGKVCVPGLLESALYWRHCFLHHCISSHRQAGMCEGTQYKELSTGFQQEVLTHAEHSYSGVPGLCHAAGMLSWLLEGPRGCSAWMWSPGWTLRTTPSYNSWKCVLRAHPASNQGSGVSHSGPSKADTIYTDAQNPQALPHRSDHVVVY